MVCVGIFGVSFAALFAAQFAELSDPGPVGLGFKIVDVDPHRNDLMVIVEVGAAMAFEHQFRVAPNLSRRPAHEAGRMFVDGGSERYLH